MTGNELQVPFVFHNYCKKRMESKAKIKLDFLKAFHSSISKHITS